METSASNNGNQELVIDQQNLIASAGHLVIDRLESNKDNPQQQPIPTRPQAPIRVEFPAPDYLLWKRLIDRNPGVFGR